MGTSHREPIPAPTAWIGSQMQEQESWRLQFDDSAIAEIDAALRNVQSKGLSIPFPREDFPLPTVAAMLDTIPDRLEDAHGFLLIRGIPRERYSVEECETIYYGLGIHIGDPLRQSEGELVGHIQAKDEYAEQAKSARAPVKPGADEAVAGGRQHAGQMDYHADRLPMDALGLFCLNTAKAGGESILVSAATIHNVLLEERPDLLDILYEPFNVDWKGGGPPDEPWYPMPMFSYFDGRFTSRVISRQFLKSVAKYGEGLGLSQIQTEAVDALQEVASRPEIKLTMDLRPGDMQFLNNHTILHAREAFEDSDEPEHQRHFLRLWLAYPPGRRRNVVPVIAEQRARFVDTGGLPTPKNYSSSGAVATAER